MSLVAVLYRAEVSEMGFSGEREGNICYCDLWRGMREVPFTLTVLLFASEEDVVFQNRDHISNFSFWLILVTWDILEKNSYTI